MSNVVNYAGRRSGYLVVIKGTRYTKVHGKTVTFVKVRCVCGKVKELHATALGKTRSCGCKARALRRRGWLPTKEIATTIVYDVYKNAAKRKGRHWGLTRQDVGNLIFKPYYYCGKLKSNVGHTNRRSNTIRTLGRSYRTYRYNGIDRKSNSAGYRKGNVVPCCKYCNYAKRDRSSKQFLADVRQIARFQGWFR